MSAVADLVVIEQNIHENHHFHVNTFSNVDDIDASKDEVSTI